MLAQPRPRRRSLRIASASCSGRHSDFGRPTWMMPGSVLCSYRKLSRMVFDRNPTSTSIESMGALPWSRAFLHPPPRACSCLRRCCLPQWLPLPLRLRPHSDGVGRRFSGPAITPGRQCGAPASPDRSATTPGRGSSAAAETLPLADDTTTVRRSRRRRSDATSRSDGACVASPNWNRPSCSTRRSVDHGVG